MNKLPVSAYIITYNEEENIRQCLESLKDFAEIVVVDSQSEDKTVEICKEFTEKVYQRPWPGHTKQYVYALSLTTNEWAFWLDADEVASPELLDEIQRIFDGEREEEVAGYYISRMTYYMVRWIRHGSWYPDYKLRLFKKALGKYVGDDPHMKVVVDGKTRWLKGKILHHTTRTFSEHLRTVDRYSDIYAQNRMNASSNFSVIAMIFRPMAEFLKCYIFKAGFREGIPGFIIAVTSAFAVFSRYVKFWEKKYSLTRKP